MATYLRMLVIGGFLPIGIATGCARRVPEPIGGRVGSPQVGWVIMSGDNDNADREFVCQSNPPSECVIPADRPDPRVLSHVHLYFHPTTTETKYTGSIRIGFFGQPHEFNPNITVKPGESPGNLSVRYFVSNKPGVYDMTIAVVATSVPTGAKTPIQAQVRVTVR